MGLGPFLLTLILFLVLQLGQDSIWYRTGVAPEVTQGSNQSQDGFEAFCQRTTGLSQVRGTEGSGQAWLAPLKECTGWSSHGQIVRYPRGPHHGPEESSANALLRLLRPYRQKGGLFLLRVWLAVPGRAVYCGTAPTSLAIQFKLECPREDRQPDSEKEKIATLSAQRRWTNWVDYQQRQGKWERQTGGAKAPGLAVASIGSTTSKVGSTIVLFYDAEFLGGPVATGLAAGDTSILQRGAPTGRGEHVGGSRAAAKPDAEQGSPSRGGFTEQGPDGAASCPGGQAGVCSRLVRLHVQAANSVGGSAVRAKQGPTGLCRARREVEATAQRIYFFVGQAFRRRTAGQLRGGRQQRHEDCERRDEGPMGNGRDNTTAQGATSRAAYSLSDGKGESGGSVARATSKRTHSPAICSRRRRAGGPSQGPGMSLKILSGPFWALRVQQWTHSVVGCSDFVFPPLAQFFGLHRELDEALRAQGFSSSVAWPDPRIEVDPADKDAYTTQAWGACVDGSPSRVVPGLGARDRMDSLVSIESSRGFTRGVDGASSQAPFADDGPLNCSLACTVCRAFVHRQSLSHGPDAPCVEDAYEYHSDRPHVTLGEASRMGQRERSCAKPSRSCLKHGRCLSSGFKRVSFGFEVSFWFPAPTQLQLRRETAAHTAPSAAPHDVLSPTCSPGTPFEGSGRATRPTTAFLLSTEARSLGVHDVIDDLLGDYSLDQHMQCSSSVGLVPESSNFAPSVPAAVAQDACTSTLDLYAANCSSSVGFVSELSQSSFDATRPLSSLGPIPIWQCARKKPQSKQSAFRLGAAPYQPTPQKNAGLHRPLSEAGHFRVAEPQAAALEGETPNPYSSFDAINGPRTLAAEPDWPPDRYITFAMETARLPGTPLARFLKFELIDFPGPQIALTQDHGAIRRRALVFDFRPFRGGVETIDVQSPSSVLDHVRQSLTIADVAAAVSTVESHSCTTLVNGVIAAPGDPLPLNADLILFQLWRDGTPLITWRPFQFGDARPPVPPIPEDPEELGTAQGFRVLAGATNSSPAAIPRYAPAHMSAPPSRYSFMDVRIGVSNRPKPPPGTDQACVDDAIAAVPAGAQPPRGARIIMRPLSGLFQPQVIVTRVLHAEGWHTIAIDLRPANLGVKVINVRLGSSIRQLFAYDSPLQQELVELGRGEIIFSYMMNLEPCLLDTAFHVRTDTITMTPLMSQGAASSSSSGQAQHTRWARRLYPQPAELSHALSEGMEDTFTVYDTVHHFRILRCESTDTPDLLIARAMSMTPEIQNAEGHLLLHGIADLPFPQIVLSHAGSADLVVPLLYKAHPPAICTTAVPPRASAFEVAYLASRSCRALHGAQHQIARRTALILGHQGSVDPFQPGCALEHGVLVLRGYSFAASALRRRWRASGLPAPDFVEARQWDPLEDLSVEDTHRIRVFVTRAPPGSVEVVPTATLRQVREYISLFCPTGPPASLRWPTFCPALPGAVPIVLALSEEALQESDRWGLVDIRRVGHPPLLPFQTVPLPPFLDLRTALELLRYELPSLRPISSAYLNDYVLHEEPRVVGDVMVLTVMRFDPDRATNAPALEPALDMNMDLLERRTAMRVFFNRHDPRMTGSQAHASVLGMSSTSQSVTEDSTDASASFHSGALTEDLDVDVGLALDLDPIHTTASGQGTQTSTSTTTTTASFSRSRRCRSRSPGPRSSNLVSSFEDVWVAHLRVFAVCGNCRPLKVTVAASARLAEILAHFTTAFADMRVIPDAAHWILSQRVHWTYDGALAIFLLTGWGSLEPRSVAVWIEPGHRWQEPFVTSIPNHASRAQILACIRLPGLDAAVITIDGVIWDGRPRFFHNGEVLQLRSSWHHLGTLPTHLVSDRVLGLLALHCGYHGPARVRQDPLHGPALARHSRQHFDTCFRPVMERFLPSVTCNNIFLVVQTGPFLYLSLGTRLPPCVEDVQMFYDDFIMPMHGPRCIEDAKMVWEDACIFLARTPEFPCSLWLLLGTPSLDVIQLDSGQDLSQWPAPPGRVWFPGETRGNVGIAFLQNIDSVGECPGPPRLAHISVRPPWPAGVPHVSFSDDEVHGCTHSVRSLFGSSSSEAEDVYTGPVTQNDPARSSWEPADANHREHGDGNVPEDPNSSSDSSSSSSGVVLLQQRLELGKDVHAQPKQELRRRIPTPCRSFKPCPSVHCSDVQTRRPDPGPASSMGAPISVETPSPFRCFPEFPEFRPPPVFHGEVRSARDFVEQASDAHFWTPFGPQVCSSYELLRLLTDACARANRSHGPRIPLVLQPFVQKPPQGARAHTVAALSVAAQLLSTLCSGVFFMVPCPYLWQMQLSQATLSALSHLQGPLLHFHALPLGSCVHLYTDGSRSTSAVGWAVVVLVQLPEQRWLFQGVLAACSNDGIFGESQHTSGEAEAAGICAALSWALSLPLHVPFRVHIDCDWARCQAAGSWTQGSKPTQGSPFFISRQLVLLHQSLERDFALLPVRSHLGHPWNDLADAAARVVCCAGSQTVSPLAAAWTKVLRSEVAPWLWLLPESRWHSAVPAVWALAVDSPPPNPPSLDSCVRQFEKVLDLGSRSGREDSLSLRCSFASFNVTTLRPAKAGLVVAQAATRERGVQALLQQQFHAKGLLFVGLQETRVPASAAYASGSYIVLSASADDTGQGGVALRISTQLPYATDGRGKAFYFQKKHCVVLFADPRRLYVKVCAPGINLLLCVWHAPHSMRPADERTCWWQEA